MVTANFAVSLELKIENLGVIRKIVRIYNTTHRAKNEHICYFRLNKYRELVMLRLFLWDTRKKTKTFGVFCGLRCIKENENRMKNEEIMVDSNEDKQWDNLHKHLDSGKAGGGGGGNNVACWLVDYTLCSPKTTLSESCNVMNPSDRLPNDFVVRS